MSKHCRECGGSVDGSQAYIPNDAEQLREEIGHSMQRLANVTGQLMRERADARRLSDHAAHLAEQLARVTLDLRAAESAFAVASRDGLQALDKVAKLNKYTAHLRKALEVLRREGREALRAQIRAESQRDDLLDELRERIASLEQE